MNIFMNTYTRTILVPLFALCVAGLVTTPVQAQSVDFGADIVNRYVWRGTDFGNAAAIQPDLSFSSGGFTIGSWGSFEISPTGGNAVNEHDLYASYAFETSSGTFSIGVTDYYFPSPSNDYFDYEGDGEGAHTIEPNVSYSGPISLYAAINAYGRTENEIWLEASVPFSVQDVDLSLALGGTPNDEVGFYGTDASTDAAITKLSLSASKSVEITDSFSLPLMISYYLNPYEEQSFFIFGVSL
jgi:hypothetical protein